MVWLGLLTQNRIKQKNTYLLCVDVFKNIF
jgi:hypothetical protein